VGGNDYLQEVPVGIQELSMWDLLQQNSWNRREPELDIQLVLLMAGLGTQKMEVDRLVLLDSL